MMVEQAPLDTDTLSLIMRQEPAVTARAAEYLIQYPSFTFSIFTRYEILRGLKAKSATKQLSAFDTFCISNIIIPISEACVVEASEIYAILRRNGDLIGDADILIAATAITENLVLVTNNERHFSRINGLRVKNWLS